MKTSAHRRGPTYQNEGPFPLKGGSGLFCLEIESMENKQVLRIDYSDAPRMSRTDEGYLTGMARVARIGIQAYQNGDGTIRRELRRPEEAFAKRTLDSFKNLPVTMGHPPEKIVTAENAKRLSVGHVGENIHVDGRWIVMPITITDAETIQRIEGGEAVQLSAGYMSEVLDEAGEYDGEVYDAVQTQITGNHVAVVQRARAGEAARLNLDAADAVMVAQTEIKQDGDEIMSDKTVMLRVDGIEYAVPPEVERHVAKLDEQMQATKAELDQAKQDAETDKAKLDEKEAELEKLKADNSDEKIKEAAKARIDLERKAMTVLDEETVKAIGDMSDRQIQEAVVKAVHTDVDLAEASDIYVQARFDAALDTHKAHGDAMAKQRQQVQQPVTDGDAKSLADKKAEAEDAIKNMYRKKDKK